ncbi:hypothetical protein ACRYCC_17675 [Actinomadura scrupuli]|uniref:hypothetical protein n=1 Tax=Actinomadura scrupuli TaxID=559629 RepID=UPI003D97DE90
MSVAVLNRGAASDPAARDRFRAAITGELDAVAGAQPDGPAPWVATLREPGRPGAGRFLDAVVLEGRLLGRWGRRGPQFQPYWAGSHEPALATPEPVGVPGAPAAAPVGRGLAGTVLFLAGVLALLALLLTVLFACRPSTPFPKPAPPSDVPSRTLVPSPLPSSGPGSPSPTPSPGSGSPSRSPRSPTPGDGDGPGGGGPL